MPDRNRAAASAPRVSAGQVWASPTDRIEYVVVTTRSPWHVKSDPPAARLHPVGLRRQTRITVTHRVLRRDWIFARTDPGELRVARVVLEQRAASEPLPGRADGNAGTGRGATPPVESRHGARGAEPSIGPASRGSLARATCPVCRAEVATRQRGLLRSHPDHRHEMYGVPGAVREGKVPICEGSGNLVMLKAGA